MLAQIEIERLSREAPPEVAEIVAGRDGSNESGEAITVEHQASVAAIAPAASAPNPFAAL